LFFRFVSAYANSEPEYLDDNEYDDENIDEEEGGAGDTPTILSKERDLQVMVKDDIELPCETEAGGTFLKNITYL